MLNQKLLIDDLNRIIQGADKKSERRLDRVHGEFSRKLANAQLENEALNKGEEGYKSSNEKLRERIKGISDEAAVGLQPVVLRAQRVHTGQALYGLLFSKTQIELMNIVQTSCFYDVTFPWTKC